MKAIITIFMVVFLISMSNAIQISYEDMTFVHSLRCCNSTHCVNLHYNANMTYRYTDLNPDYCYEIGGFEKTDWVSSAIWILPLIVVIGLIVIYIVKLKKRENES